MTLPSSGPLTLADIQTEFGGSNPISLSEYYAGGANVPAATSGTYGAVPSSGTISIQNFYGTSDFVPVYIADVFSTSLYTGNNTTNTISNGINLSSNGGLIWTKVRTDTDSHALVDTVRGFNYIQSNGSGGQGSTGTAFSSFNSNGYTLGVDSISSVNQFGPSYVSWTFRQQPKFFDVVTYTGNGVNGTAIPHTLGVTPACVLYKQTSSAQSWRVYHASMTNPTDTLMVLNSSSGEIPQGGTVFGVSSSDINVYYDMNTNGQTYVAYLFASNAGGFGPTGVDNVITCGSYTGNGSASGPTISLGYEPQWLMIKNATGTGDWQILDNVRGMPSIGSDATLQANQNSAESLADYVSPSGSGFQVVSTSSQVNTSASNYIYIAIRD